MDIRLIASDIEGTLTNAQGEIPPLTRRVLTALSERLPVVLVTGLNPWPARRHLQHLGPRVSAILQNGVFVWEEGRTSERLLVDPAITREAARLLYERGYVPLVYGIDDVTRYLPHIEGMTMVSPLIARRPYQPYWAVDTLEELFAVTPVQLSVCDTESRVRAIHPLLAGLFGTHAYVVLQPQPGRESWVEMNHPQARKAVALLAFAERRGIAPGQILYCGDSLNDLEVMHQVGYPVAVSNALPEIQALAWRRTASAAEEGIARFLIQLFDLPVLPE